jgi:hypothetical protein
MNRILPLFLLFLTGCVSYQHITLSSDQPVEPDTRRYYTEGDGVKIAYDFGGPNFPITAFIYNRTDSMLFVDLGSSSFTLNGNVVANAINPKLVRFHARSDNSFSGWTQSTEGTAVIPPDKNIIGIPPHSYTELTNYPFHVKYDPRKKNLYTEKVDVPDQYGTYSVKRYDYDDQDSVFGVHYVVSGNRSFSPFQLLSAEFQRESLYNTKNDFLIIEKPSPQRYIVSHTDKTAGVVLSIGLLGTIIVAAVQADPQEDQ